MRPRCLLSGAEVSRETIASAAPSVRRTPQSPLEPQPPTNAHHKLGAEYLAASDRRLSQTYAITLNMQGKKRK